MTTAAPDFIEVYDGALGAVACRALIERFDASDKAKRGATGSGVDVALKDSWDIQLQSELKINANVTITGPTNGGIPLLTIHGNQPGFFSSGNRVFTVNGAASALI